MDGPTRDNNEKSMFDTLLKKIADPNFIVGLGLMNDALQKLSEVSEAFQNHNVGWGLSTKKLKITASLFDSRKSVPGPH